ncbi:MAG: hypothetical protein AAF386_05545 [Pseudomonadota bacterium]
MEQQAPPKKKRAWIIALLIVLLGAGYTWWYRGPLFAPQPDVATPAAPVAVGPVAPQDDTDISGVADVAAPNPSPSPAINASAPSAPLAEVPELDVAIQSTPAPAPELADPPVADATPTLDAPDLVPTVDAAPELVPATFDVVRVEDDGIALIAGAVGTGGTVYLTVDGERQDDTATAAAQGSDFVIFTNFAPSAALRVLQLLVETPDGQTVLSRQKVYVSPRAPAPQVAAAPDIDTTTAVAAAAPEVGLEAAPADANTDTSATVQATLEVEPSDEAAEPTDDPGEPAKNAEDQNQPPQLLLADEDGDLRVLAAPVATVALDTIQYDLDGEVDIGGRAAGDGFVRVYLDNKPITTSRIQDGGFWNISLPNIETGIYTLRVDELDTSGDVTSRVETPFQREAPELLSAFSEPGSAFNVKAMTVQPGTTLWAMAVAKYGDGMQFMKVFDVNRDTIRDPNMIFPGQIFDLPD